MLSRTRQGVRPARVPGCAVLDTTQNHEDAHPLGPGWERSYGKRAGGRFSPFLATRRFTRASRKGRCWLASYSDADEHGVRKFVSAWRLHQFRCCLLTRASHQYRGYNAPYCARNRRSRHHSTGMSLADKKNNSGFVGAPRPKGVLNLAGRRGPCPVVKRRKRRFSFETGGSFGYDRGSKPNKWGILDNMVRPTCSQSQGAMR